MIAFSLRVQSRRAEWLEDGGHGQRVFNGYVRQALVAAVRLWADRFRPLHFGVGSFGRYNYAGRGFRYQQKKRFAPRIRDASRALVPNPNYGKTPEPWLYTGTTKAMVLGATTDELVGRAKAVATSNKQRVTLRIPLGHPINPKNVGELTTIRDDEFRAMSQRAHAVLSQLVREARKVAIAA